MALSFSTPAGTLLIPGAYSSYTVQTSNSGLSTNGVVALVGEADAGPDYTKESDLSLNFFGPDQLANVVAKYKTGNLVDAFRAVANPANDINILGAPSQIVFIKTNPSVKASASILKHDGSSYGTVADKSYGKLGNLIYVDVLTKTAEVVPTTGSFTWLPNAGTVNAELRVNGGSGQSLALSANTSPTALVSAVNGLTGVTATGGAARTVIPGVSGNLTVASVSGNSFTVTYSSTWTTTPSIGDTFIIPIGSAIVGAASANVGAYVVTAATTNSISVTKLSDAGASSPVPGTITAPAAVGSTAVTGTTNFTVFAPVVISVSAANPVAGAGKSLEIAGLGTGTDLLVRCAYNLSTTAVTWVSVSGTPQLLTSAAEYVCTFDANRQFDAMSESFDIGGDVALSLSYTGTTASVTVSATTMTSSVAGGSGAAFATVTLADYPTIADLAAYLNTLTGWKATVGNNVLGSLPSTALDQATFNCSSTWGAKNARLKVDAYKFYTKLSTDSVLVQLGATPARAAAGIPGPTGSVFMTGGTKGGTTDAIVSAALAALEKVQCNFVVPLFSRDASSDITDGLTDSTSTYTIANVHANTKSHILAMNKLKAQRFRQGCLSIRTTFAAAKNTAAGIASPLCTMSFLDQKVLAADGTIKQFQPWMDAVLAAGVQTAGFYRSIMRKVKNCSGSLQAAGDFNDQSQSDIETALQAGLLVTTRNHNGAYVFVSDQTTYGTDPNFVYNSMQAVYAANLIAATSKLRMEDAFVGQSIADVSAPVAKTYFEGIMADFLRLKLITPSDDAKAGFKDLRVVISGVALLVSVNIKLANAIAFIPISFTISATTQTA
jgi:hypothetical protein